MDPQPEAATRRWDLGNEGSLIMTGDDLLRAATPNE